MQRGDVRIARMIAGELVGEVDHAGERARGLMPAAA
jgi:hypothetical protein